MIGKDDKRFRDPGIRYLTDNPQLKFSDYILHWKKILMRYRNDLKSDHAERIIEANLPVELYPQTPVYSTTHPQKIKYGALLIHGLLDSPFMMKDIGIELQTAGLLVRSIVLPGHATVPESLLHVTLEEWIQAVQYGVHSLAKEVDDIILVGFSTGATLSFYHTLKHANQIAAIIMLSPAFKINTHFDFLTNSHKLISWAWPRAKWLYQNEEIDYTKYMSVPLNAPYQVYRLTKAIKKIDHTREVKCPIFIALSNEDLIVSSKATLNYFQAWKNPMNKMILYTEKMQTINDARIIQRSSSYPAWHIKNFSHVSIPTSPQNAHYGMHGDFPLASHVEENKNYIYCATNKPLEMYHRILYKLKLTPYEIRRLTFNPDFDFMMQQIKKFIFNHDEISGLRFP